MALTNTGGSRAQAVTIQTKVGGVVTDTTTYWITQEIPAGFTFLYLGNVVTENDLATLPEGDHSAPASGTYADLLAQFRTAVEAEYTGLDTSAEESNTAYKAVDTSCPISTGSGVGGGA